jgi:hypothetical protein
MATETKQATCKICLEELTRVLDNIPHLKGKSVGDYLPNVCDTPGCVCLVGPKGSGKCATHYQPNAMCRICGINKIYRSHKMVSFLCEYCQIMRMNRNTLNTSSSSSSNSSSSASSNSSSSASSNSSSSSTS